MKHIYLLKQLSKRDILSRYKGSAVGMLWSFIMPLVMLSIYTFVFSVVFNARWGGETDSKLSFALNLFAGMIIHGLFSEVISRSATLLQCFGGTLAQFFGWNECR